jgi:hypothetical protein
MIDISREYIRPFSVLLVVIGFGALAVAAAGPAVAADAPPRIVVTTSVSPADAGPGSAVTQTVQVANNGDGAAALLLVTGDLAPGCRWTYTVLLPRQARSATCSGVVGPGVTRLTISVSGRTRGGDPVQASGSVQLRAPEPARAGPAPAAPPAPAPAPAQAPAPIPAPVQAPAPAQPGRQPAAPAAPRAPAVEASRAASAAPAAPTTSPAPRPAVQRRPSVRPVRQEGPLSAPGRTAAIVAVLGVFVMTVSVGAISAAVRVR